MYDILIVDDEDDICALVAGLLEDEGYSPRQAQTGLNALEQIGKRRPSLVLLDVWLGDTRYDGLKILELIKQDHPDVPVIMMSGHGTLETAVAAIKRGAYDFIEKPFQVDRLLLFVKRALESARLRQENKILKEKVTIPSLLGTSPAMAALRKNIEKVAPTNSRVFISGATGTGKEEIAREIHYLSKRKEAPFLVLNCALIEASHLEEELFGVEGPERKIGILEQAHNGTLYLDEVADLSPLTQGKLVRVLQEQTFCRVGGQQKVEVDVRLISSTRLNIRQEVDLGHFREDLFYRLGVVPMDVPLLKSRREDIPALIEAFMDSSSLAMGLPKVSLSSAVMDALLVYEWPGNVRELKNVVDRILILAQGQEATLDHLPPEISLRSLAPSEGLDFLSLPLKEAREHFERQYLLSQLDRFNGNVSQTASFVGMERSALHRKIKTLEVAKAS